MFTTIRLILCAALALASAVTGTASAAPPPRDIHYGTATIRSAQADGLRDDGKGAYGNRLVWVRDNPDASRDDLFAIYTGNKRSFSVFWDGRSATCVGISHVFFEGVAWWEKTAAVGDTFIGGASVWCDTPTGADYWVRYPGMRDEAGEDCVIARRIEGPATSRTYEFTPREMVPGTAADDLHELSEGLLGDGGTAETPGCDARVYEVLNLGKPNETRTVIWEGPAPFLITATVD